MAYPPQGSQASDQSGIPSTPPSGKPSTCKKIANIYWDDATQEIVVEYE